MTQYQFVSSAQLCPDGCWINHRELPVYVAEPGPSFDAESSILWLPLLVEPGPTAVNYTPPSEQRLLFSLTVNTPRKELTMNDIRTDICNELDSLIATAVDRAGRVVDADADEASEWLHVATQATDLKDRIKPKKTTSF